MLPAGIHPSTLDQFEARFAFNSHRKRLAGGLFRAVDCLRFAGCRVVYVDGSFVTKKELPTDYDAAWSPSGVDVDLLLQIDPVFGQFENQRATQKAKYLGEWFPADAPEQSSGSTFLDFFQIDKESGSSKGIVAIELPQCEGN